MEWDLIGYGGLIIGRASFEESEIAYELFRRAHGHDYATEAAAAIIAAAAATGRGCGRPWAPGTPHRFEYSTRTVFGAITPRRT